MTVDQYGIPQRVLTTCDEDLMGLLGRTAALASILEMKVAAIASNVENGLPDSYFAASRSENEKTIRSRLRLFSESYEKDTVATILAALPVARAALEERNQILHRVWTRAVKDVPGVWYGYKSVRADDSEKPARLDGKVFTRQDFEPVFQAMVDAIDVLSDAVGLSGSLARRA